MIKNDNKIWSDLASKVAKKGGDGEAFVLALQDLYSIFTPDFATWIGGLYNHELGGFHAANSGRDTEGYYPDIESTFQAVNTIATVGIVKKATDLPPVMREKLISFISSLQSPDDGYMYHPWWDYNDPEWRHRDARLGRDMMWAISLEKELDFKLPYPGYKVLPFDLNGDGYHEFFVTDESGRGDILDCDGNKIAHIDGGACRFGKMLDMPGEQVMVANGNVFEIWADLDAVDGEVMKRRYKRPYLKFMNKLMATGYNSEGTQVACTI